MEKKNLSHFAPIFPVSDIKQTLAWYEEKLGFKTQFTWEEPVTYAIVRRDEITIHFALHEDLKLPLKPHTSLYVFVYDIDALFKELKEKGVTQGEIFNADYGMRDFDITDLNGYRITFGQNAEEN